MKPKKPQKKTNRKKRPEESVVKHFKFGMELELFTLDKNGYITSAADRLVKRVKKEFPNIGIKGEIGRHMIELFCLPEQNIPNIMSTLMDDFKSVLYCAEKEEIVLYPFGTYPGAFTPEFQKKKRYQLMRENLGAARFDITGRCVGFHAHYTLPYGVFDTKTKSLKKLINSKHKQSLVNIYNLFIAMDPALITLTQSSPYYQGKRLGKDARVITFRGGKALGYEQGLYGDRQNIGALPEYKATGSDLIHMFRTRLEERTEEIRKKNRNNVFETAKSKSVLDLMRAPVRINPIGTIEQKGMDTNHPRVIAAVALIIKHLGQKVQEEFVQVAPSDAAIEDPFKMENGTIYIPPHTHVRFTLQPSAAYEGLENEEVHKYCANLLRLAKICVPKNSHPLLEPLENMVKKRKTIADEIIENASAFGATQTKGINKQQAADLALDLSKDLHKEVLVTKQMLEKVEE
jgi:hypothetical protein